MNISRRPFRPAFIIGAIAAVFSMSFASRAGAQDAGSQHMWSLSIPAGFSTTAVQQDIVAVLSHRKWEVREQAPGRVVGYLKHRGDEAFVTFKFNSSIVDVFCEGWKVDSSGAHEKPEIKSRWMDFLQQDLNKLLYPPLSH